jgi:magnesium chelatase family protein
MLAKVLSGATVGLDPITITVEVDIYLKSLPSFTIVGLPSKSIEESKERVRAAIKNSGAEFPTHRITVNLAPADIPKEGPSYDLPIALGILIASGQLKAYSDKILVLGELSLDGTLRHTKGILPMMILAKNKGYKSIFLPSTNAQEASVIKGVDVYPVESLITIYKHFAGIKTIEKYPYTPFTKLKIDINSEFDFSDIKGQEQAKRVFEISAAGGHNLFIKGVPGAGKTMLARALPGILPDLTESEALEVTKIYSITGNIPIGEAIIKTRPFRAPHHTTSRIGLIGGGAKPMPGEISLAHRGVLFLDEFPEYPRHVLESLRQPMEDGIVTISRAAGTLSYPAKFILVAAANPCPCGFYGDEVRKCNCLPGKILQYQKRISGPILDRIDLHINLPPVRVERLTVDQKSEESKIIKIRIQRARDLQTQRYSKTIYTCNSDLTSRAVKEYIKLSSECLSLIRNAVVSLNLSARSYYRVLKISRTIADLEKSIEISPYHISEALQYRVREENI